MGTNSNDQNLEICQCIRILNTLAYCLLTSVGRYALKPIGSAPLISKRNRYRRGFSPLKCYKHIKVLFLLWRKRPIPEPTILTPNLLKRLIRPMTRSMACRGTDLMLIGHKWHTHLPPKCILARKNVYADACKILADYGWQLICLSRKRYGLVIIHAILLICLS